MEPVVLDALYLAAFPAVPVDWQDPAAWLAVVAAAEAAVILALVALVLRLRARLRTIRSAPAPAGRRESTQSELASLYDKALTGSLDRFAINEVIQFVHNIGETGILDIRDESVSAVHRLLIRQGEIIDAFNGELRGEPAVHAILECRQGSFTFIRGDLPSHDRTITKPTMTMLMERMQKIDESAGAGELFQRRA